MQKDFEGNWISVHALAWAASDKKMKDTQTVVAFVDKQFRAVADTYKTSHLPKLHDFVMANQLFANLTNDIKNEMVATNSHHFIEGTKPSEEWTFASIFEMAVKIESSPKFQADLKRNKHIARISSVSASAVDNSFSGSPQNFNEDVTFATGAISAPYTRSQYFEEHNKAFANMIKEEKSAYAHRTQQIRAEGPKVPAADGKVYTTQKGQNRSCADITHLEGVLSCNSSGHDAPQCPLNKAIFAAMPSNVAAVSTRTNSRQRGKTSVIRIWAKQ